MATLRQRRASNPDVDPTRDFGLDDLAEWITAGDVTFPVSPRVTQLGGSTIELSEPVNYAHSIVKRNGIVFSCMDIRAKVFSEVQWKFQALAGDKPGKLFGSSALGLLENPWPNGTTGELAYRMIQDADYAGNFYAIARNGRIYRRHPLHTSIVLSGDPAQEEFVDVVAYIYQPKGVGGPVHTYMPEDVVHWSPIPDPEAEYRGMSWLTPVLREIDADGAATDHKAAYFRNGATPNFAVTIPQDVMTPDQFDDFRRKMVQSHQGSRNAYRTLYLAPGADVKPLGSDLTQLSFNDTQGRDETRIAAAAGVPAVLVGLKESMQGSSLNAGNYGQSRRRFGDGTMRPLYRSAAGALQKLAPPPVGSPARLWYDASQVAFFREDRADDAAIQEKNAAAMRNLVDAGYVPETVVEAIDTGDWTKLKHSGLFSVQLQPPNSSQAAPKPASPAPAPAAKA